MNIDAISELIAIVLAISLATERLVVAIRTPKNFLGFIPTGEWLNKEKAQEDDGLRRFFVQLVSFACATFTVGWLTPDVNEIWDPLARITIANQSFPLLIIALLATGGSSFWKNILGYTKAVRDIRKDEQKRKKNQ